jgi:hypothetical protein
MWVPFNLNKINVGFSRLGLAKITESAFNTHFFKRIRELHLARDVALFEAIRLADGFEGHVILNNRRPVVKIRKTL